MRLLCPILVVSLLTSCGVTATWLTSAPWPPPGTEIYTSTNSFMLAAIKRNAEAFDPLAPHRAYTAMMGNYNSLLDAEWDTIGFAPAREAMRAWAADLFKFRGTTGLLPTMYPAGSRRMYDADSGAWARGVALGDNDGRYYCALDTTYASRIDSLVRMNDMLRWFPTDATLLANCLGWAKAVARVNTGSDAGGHCSSSSAYTLFNYVQVGLPEGSSLLPGDPLESQLRYALEGLPGSWWSQSGQYGALAMAFERLSAVAADPTWSTHARRITDGVWNSRFNKTIYVFPDTYTPSGPVPGDQEGGPGYRYKYDTDSLYWINALYQAYGAADGSVPAATWPSDDGAPFVVRAANRRAPIDSRIAAEPHPRRYLWYALGATVDWTRIAWSDSRRQSTRKIFHEGSVDPVPYMYNDGKANTLRMLVQGYRYTRDPFYLDLFEEAWDQLLAVSLSRPETLPPATPVLFHGTIPTAIRDGALPVDAGTEANQDVYLGLLVDAYRASIEAGIARPALLSRAESFAASLLVRLANPAWAPYLYRTYNGVLGNALMRLARSRATLRRVGISVLATGETLTFRRAGVVLLILTLPAQRAVVYMDTGEYSITSSAGGATWTITISVDTDLTAPF